MGGVDLIVAHPGTEGLVNCRNIALTLKILNLETLGPNE